VSEAPVPPATDAAGADGYCDACGTPAGEGDHARCRARRSISDPPRYCRNCGRKLVVQVLPASWTAACVRCGPLEAPL
jgi:hypothetical protein